MGLYPVSDVGDHVYYDPVLSIDCRQHGANLAGKNTGWQARLLRLRLLIQGCLRKWIEQHVFFLEQAEGLLTPHNRQVFACFRLARSSSLIDRIKGARQSGIFRQMRIDYARIIAAVLLRCV